MFFRLGIVATNIFVCSMFSLVLSHCIGYDVDTMFVDSCTYSANGKRTPDICCASPFVKMELMLAYLLVQELSRCWRSVDIAVEEGLDELNSLCTTQVVVKGKSLLHNVPQPRDSVAQLLRAAQVEMPRKLASRGMHVSTRKKLVEERKTA